MMAVNDQMSPKRLATARAAGMVAELISLADTGPRRAQALRDAGLAHNTFVAWQKGKYQPNLTSVLAVLDALGYMLVIVPVPSCAAGSDGA